MNTTSWAPLTPSLSGGARATGSLRRYSITVGGGVHRPLPPGGEGARRADEGAPAVVSSEDPHFFHGDFAGRGLGVHLRQLCDDCSRLALYPTRQEGRVVSVDEVSRAFAISRHDLVKVVQALTDLGVVEAHRGRGGGEVDPPARLRLRIRSRRAIRGGSSRAASR